MTLPIGIQLWSLRDQLAQDFEKTLEAVSSMGYTGVETAGLYERNAADVATLLRDLNLQVIGMHAPILTAEDRARSQEDAVALGCRELVCAWRPPELFQSVDTLKALAEELNAISAELNGNGFTLHYHNHDAELRALDGRPALYTFADQLDPAIRLEVDVYWALVAGADPVTVLRDLGDRARLIHLKDGAVEPATPNTAVGAGTVAYAPIIAALPASTTHLIVEMDSCATDMLEAVQHSIQYIIGQGWGHGR